MATMVARARALRSFWPNQLAIDNSEVALAVILALYAGLIILWPGPGLHPDERAMATVLRGEYLDPNTYVIPKEGRFHPFNGQEYNLLVPFTSSPIFYNALVALQFLIAYIAIYLLMKRVHDRPVFNSVLIFGVLIGAGNAAVWLRLLMSEPSMTLYSAGFLLSLHLFWRKPSVALALVGLASLNAALYSKEVASVGAIGVVVPALCIAVSQRRTHVYKFLIASAFSIAVFGALYIGFVVLGHEFASEFYWHSLRRPSQTVIKFATYALEHPILIAIFLPSYLYRTWKILRGERTPGLMDAIGTGGLLILAFYMAYTTTTTYYVYPVYAFALPYIVHVLPTNWYRTVRGAVAILFCIMALAVQGVPLALHQTTFHKYSARNLDMTMDFLVTTLNEETSNEPIRIFIYKDVSSNLVGGVAGQLEGHLITSPDGPGRSISVDCLSADTDLSELAKGDYIIAYPYSFNYKQDVDRFVFDVEEGYDILLRTRSKFAVPVVTLKERVKAVILRSKWQSEVSHPRTYFWPDFVVLRRTGKPLAQVPYPADDGRPIKNNLGFETVCQEPAYVGRPIKNNLGFD